MRVQVRLFAALAEAAGSRSFALDVPEGATADDVRDVLAGRYPEVAPLCTHVAFAVNAEYKEARTPLHDGDEVALIPPVSGG